MKKQVKISSREIRETIEAGDNCDGYYVIAISPNGEWRTCWTSRTSQWEQYGDDDVIYKIPALVPEGDGEYYYEAEHAYKWGESGAPTQDEIGHMVDDGKIISGFDWIEQNDPEWLEAYKDNCLDFLESAFESALNGFGEELNDPCPWYGQEINGKSPEEIFQFQLEGAR